MPFTQLQTWTGLLTLLGVGFVVYALALIVATAYKLTHPRRRTYAWAVARSLPGDPGELPSPRAFTTWTTTSRGRTIEAWDLEGDDPEGPVIVYTHGWGSSRISSLVRVDALAGVASRIVSWDMPGHGETRGPTTLGAREGDDLHEVLRAVDPKRPLVLYGYSLGAEVVLDVATRDSDIAPVGVVIEGAYARGITPARNVLRLSRQPNVLNLIPAMLAIGTMFRADPMYRFRPLQTERAGRLRVPLLALHGGEDTTCPVADARIIADAAPTATMTVLPGCGHHDIWAKPEARAEAIASVRAWLESLSLDEPAEALEASGGKA